MEYIPVIKLFERYNPISTNNDLKIYYDTVKDMICCIYNDRYNTKINCINPITFSIFNFDRTVGDYIILHNEFNTLLVNIYWVQFDNRLVGIVQYYDNIIDLTNYNIVMPLNNICPYITLNSNDCILVFNNDNHKFEITNKLTYEDKVVSISCIENEYPYYKWKLLDNIHYELYDGLYYLSLNIINMVMHSFI
jgi:hypothetical protein